MFISKILNSVLPEEPLIYSASSPTIIAHDNASLRLGFLVVELQIQEIHILSEVQDY